MTQADPTGEIDSRFSNPGATPLAWAHADDLLTEAQIYWLSTVRGTGRPHVTPLIAVWDNRSLYFCTGPTEQKAKNLETNPQCALTTGGNALNEGLDIVVEGAATAVRDVAELQHIAAQYELKYGGDWVFTVHEGAFLGAGGRALVYKVADSTIFAFSKGDFSQTRWRLSAA